MVKGWFQSINKFILKLERKKNYVAVPGFVLRDLNDFIKTNDLSGKKIGHVIFDQAAALFIRFKIRFIIC